MSISIEHLDITTAPFTRTRCMMYIAQGYEDEAFPGKTSPLYLNHSSSVLHSNFRWDLIRIDPTYQGEVVSYTYTCNPGKLTLTTAQGTLEMCYDGRYTLRVRGSGGVGLRLFIAFRPHEQFMDRHDGTVYAAFEDHAGEFLFEATRGRQTHNGKWLARGMKPDDTTIQWTPDDSGILEAYVQIADSSVNRPEILHDFDACVAENLADVQAWYDRYLSCPEKYEQVRKLSIYDIWACHVRDLGIIKEDMIYMMRGGTLTRAMGWHQSYQAMASWKDIDFAVKLLYSMCAHADPCGKIPDGVTYMYEVRTATKPPIQGFVFTYIMERGGKERLTREHAELLYQPFCSWANWWLTYRDRDGDGLVGYMHADESGWDDASIFCKGLPLESPDIASYLILLLETCSILAEKLGLQEESEAWMARSKKMLDDMIKAFWNGRKFVCLLDGSHEVVDSWSIAVYQPIILGKRLPQNIIDKLAADLANPEMFFSPYGFTSESRLSDYYDIENDAFMLGYIQSAVQLMITVGLYRAGKTELALENARNWCDRMLEKGPETISSKNAPQLKPPMNVDGIKPILPVGRQAPGRLCTWGCAIFLVLADMLNEDYV